MKLIETIKRTLFSRDEVHTHERFLRHLLVGGIGTLGYIVLVAVLVEIAHLDPVLSVVLAFIPLEIYTYVVNRWWVYDTKSNHVVAIPKFLTATAISLALNAGLMHVATETLGLWYGWGLLLTVAVVPITNFTINLKWAFR